MKYSTLYRSAAICAVVGILLLAVSCGIAWPHASGPTCYTVGHTHSEGNCENDEFCVGTGCVPKLSDIDCTQQPGVRPYDCCGNPMSFSSGSFPFAHRKFNIRKAIGNCAPASTGDCITCDKVICATGHQAKDYACSTNFPGCSTTYCVVYTSCSIIRWRADKCD